MNVRKAGTDLVAAGYCMFSSSTVLVSSIHGLLVPFYNGSPENHVSYFSLDDASRHPIQFPPQVLSVGTGVWGFTMDAVAGEFYLTHR